MVVGCSEISISVIVKHVTHWNYQGFCLPGGDLLSFPVPGEKIAGLWFARADQYPG